MAVTNNVLNAINVFSSTSVFNSNKGSVGANDLNFIKQTTAELATEGGGIIAQSLGTNGYVKFANGLILQWGVWNCNYHGENVHTTCTLPISFTSNFYAGAATLTELAYNGVATPNITSVTKNSFVLTGDYSNSQLTNAPTYAILLGK